MRNADRFLEKKAPQRKSAEKHERRKRATNKQHGMCFVEEKCETILCDVREEKKIGAGTVKAFWFSRFDCPSLRWKCVLYIRIKM